MPADPVAFAGNPSSTMTRKPAPAAFDGALVVNKPSGRTSHDVVDAVRRLLGFRQIGHLGTLDPLATGVLVLLLGRATRFAQFMPDGASVTTARSASDLPPTPMIPTEQL
jgi:hypothetical protein